MSPLARTRSGPVKALVEGTFIDGLDGLGGPKFSIVSPIHHSAFILHHFLNRPLYAARHQQ